MVEAAIEAVGLTKVYADGTVALTGVTFEVYRGEVFGYLGRNGAGKTTTVRILSTLDKQSAGTARVCGRDVGREPRELRRLIGLSLQQAALDNLMTGYEHLRLIAALNKLTKPVRQQRIENLLSALGLGAIANRLVATYTVGMRRRLDAAMALLTSPEVLFLDEPTTGLDPQSRRALWAVVRDFRSNGGTVFLTTQHLDEADELCDRVAILDGGQVVVTDTPTGLKSSLGGKALRIRLARGAAMPDDALRQWPHHVAGDVVTVDLSGRDDDLPSLLTSLRQLGVSLQEITIVEPTLEDVFVRLTGESVDTGIERTSAATAGIERSIVSVPGGGRR